VAVFPFPPWMPDRVKVSRDATDYVKNAVPTADGWGPFPGPSVVSDALASACRGAFTAANADGSFEVFASTATTLHQLSGSSWDDVSRLAGGAYTLGAGHSWDFEQFGPRVIAVNIADAPQVFNLSSDTDFSALGGSPPNAKFVWQESGYLGLGNFTDAERTFRRSGLNDATFWTTGLRGSDIQEEPDGGAIQGAVGDERGAILFSERRIHRITNLPGEQIGFRVDTIESTRGTVAPFSVVQVGAMVFWLSEDGFYMLVPGVGSKPIGATRINRFFLRDIDLDDIDQVQGCADPTGPRIIWRYSSQDASGLDYTDRVIIYDWQLDRWSYGEQNLEWLFPIAMPGQTLEQVGAAYPDLDTLVPFSLDSRFWNAGRPALGAINSAHKLVVFEGSALEAILRTNDIAFAEGRRVAVRGFRPFGDAESCTGKVGKKEKFSDDVTWGSSNSQNSTGYIPARVTGRVARFELTVPAATEWNDVSGFEADYRVLGTR
jgi:hypothetical protein